MPPSSWAWRRWVLGIAAGDWSWGLAAHGHGAQAIDCLSLARLCSCLPPLEFFPGGSAASPACRLRPAGLAGVAPLLLSKFRPKKTLVPTRRRQALELARLQASQADRLVAWAEADLGMREATMQCGLIRDASRQREQQVGLPAATSRPQAAVGPAGGNRQAQVALPVLPTCSGSARGGRSRGRRRASCPANANPAAPSVAFRELTCARFLTTRCGPRFSHAAHALAEQRCSHVRGMQAVAGRVPVSYDACLRVSKRTPVRMLPCWLSWVAPFEAGSAGRFMLTHPGNGGGSAPPERCLLKPRRRDQVLHALFWAAHTGMFRPLHALLTGSGVT